MSKLVMLESLFLLRPSSGGLLRADSLSLLLEVPEHLHTVLLEKCSPRSGLTELSLLGPVVAAQCFFNYSRFSLDITLRLSNKILDRPFVAFTSESGVSRYKPQLTSLLTTTGILHNPWYLSTPRFPIFHSVLAPFTQLGLIPLHRECLSPRSLNLNFLSVLQ